MAERQLATLAAETREAIDSEDFPRAAEACRRALLRFPRWVEGYWLLGHILVESGFVGQARSCFEAVASAMPDDPRAYEGLAAAAEQEHDAATAVAGLIRAIEVGESSPNVQDELKRLQLQAGYPINDGFTHARIAHARLIAGQYEEADISAERGLADEPDRLDLLVVQAVARLFGGDRKGSQRVCQRLLDLSPDCLKALAILRYLTPGDQTSGLGADLDALDPEGQTLVWLHSQMTTLGYTADDLPSAPRLVRWRDDEDAATGGVSRPMDQLIPELEEVWPQWLQEAAQLPPPAAPAEATPMPVPLAGSPPAAPVPGGEGSAPSFLGDMDALVREFEEAMRASPPREPEAQSTSTDTPVEISATAASSEPPSEEAVGTVWQWSDTAVGETPAPEAPAVAGSGDPATLAPERGVWDSPPTAETPTVPTTTWLSAQETAAVDSPWDAPLPSEQEAAPAEPVPAAEPAPGAPGDQFGDWVLSLAPLGASGDFVDLHTSIAGPLPILTWEPPREPARESEPALVSEEALAPPPDPVPPAVPPQDEIDQLRRTAQEAARRGDYWTAVTHYGEALGRLRATVPGGW